MCFSRAYQRHTILAFALLAAALLEDRAFGGALLPKFSVDGPLLLEGAFLVAAVERELGKGVIADR